MRFALLLLAAALAGCHKEQPDCGDPVGPPSLTYEIVDAATGGPWFAVAGRLPADSVRLLASAGGAAAPAERRGQRLFIGPVAAFALAGGPAPQYLRFGAHDVDTLLVQLRYAAVVQGGPCPAFPALEQVAVSYNGRPAGTYRADAPADSLGQGGPQKAVPLRKR